jgi:hypothetical protein
MKRGFPEGAGFAGTPCICAEWQSAGSFKLWAWPQLPKFREKRSPNLAVGTPLHRGVPALAIRNADKINLHFKLPLLPLFSTFKTVIIST